MKVSIERGHFEALLAEFPRLQPWAAQLRFGNRVEMAFADLHDAELAQLVARYQASASSSSSPKRAPPAASACCRVSSCAACARRVTPPA